MRTKKKFTAIGLVWFFYMLFAGHGNAFGGDYRTRYFPSFADEHTVGLWLFDENQYPYTTLTDASVNEYDLRLMKGGWLVPGRFGNCLKLTPGLDYAAGYAAWKGMVSFTHMREVSGRPGSGLWGPTVAPARLVDSLAAQDFTCEFWLLLMSNPIQDVVLIDLGDKYDPGFKLTLKKRAQGFLVENAYAGFKAVCPTVLDQIWGRDWHHVAFTYSPQSNKLSFFIDGASQAPVALETIAKSQAPSARWPESLHRTTYGIFEKEKRTDVPDFEIRRRNRFNFALGHDRHGNSDFNGCIDELRFSDLIRYKSDFTLPDSFSRNYRKDAPPPSAPTGPPLLFEGTSQYDVLQLGSRKHVFIDEAFIDKKSGVKLTVNPPVDTDSTNVDVGGDTPLFDHDGKVWMVVTPGYGSSVGPIRLLFSRDGINFEKPQLGLIEHRGSTQNNLIFKHLPCWGRFFKDTNPNCHPEERFKFTGWVAQRAIYLYVSPDGIHWRRNETCMLPLVSGGGCETFYDGQRGLYVNLLKRDGSYSTGEHPAYGRGATLFQTREVAKAWPFNPVQNPYYEGWPFPAVTGEGVTVMGPDLFDPDYGQVFRTRACKYEWAPDTYVAFLARNSQTELAVSRDCMNWRIYEDQPYIPPRLEVNGRSARVEWIKDGVIRRSDRLWQYIAGEGPRNNRNVIRLSQRLDGFTSIDAGDQSGIIVTRPFVFDGDTLTLNADVTGWLKVGVLNLPGMAMTGLNVGLTNKPKKDVPGFDIENSNPVKGDSLRHFVTWKGNPNLANLAGRVVRLRIEMKNAKLFAFEFE